mgnify:CR=1 FL=1
MRKEYDFSKAELVIPALDPKKTRITIRIDTVILDWFREQCSKRGGGNYQTDINKILGDYVKVMTKYPSLIGGRNGKET